MQLKQYQTDTLTILRRFFEEARIAGPKAAYEVLVDEPEQASGWATMLAIMYH